MTFIVNNICKLTLAFVLLLTAHAAQSQVDSDAAAADQAPEQAVEEKRNNQAIPAGTVVVFSGKTQHPWIPFIGTSENWSLHVPIGGEQHAKGKSLSIRPITKTVEGDARQLDWYRQEGIIYWQSEIPLDFSGAADRDAALSIILKVDKKPKKKVELKMDCGYPCAGAIEITKQLQSAPKKKWFRLNIPVSCFAKAGAELDNIVSPALFASKGRLSMGVYDIRIVEGLPEKALLGCGQAGDEQDSQQLKDAATSIEKNVSIETGTGNLEGTLLSAHTIDKKTIALIIAGSGPTDRDGNSPAMTNNSLKMLAAELSDIGISSLRYDKRGVANSKSAGLEESDLRFEHYINDASSWIEHLNEQDNYDEIVVIGHSEGSLIGMVASQHKSVDKFISIAGAGQPVDQTIRKQLKAQPADVLKQSTPILDKLLRGETVENVPESLNSLFRPSVQPYMISWFKYDPIEEIAKLKKPVLVLHGSTDLQVSLSDSKKLAEANKNAKRVVIEKMNHIFKQASSNRQANFQTYNQADLPIKPELIQAIEDFVGKS